MRAKQGEFLKNTLAIAISASLLAAGMAVAAGAVDSASDTFGVVGSFNNWGSDCEDYVMSDDDGDGVFTVQIILSAGSYEWKVRTNNSWDDSWGLPDADGTTWNSLENCVLEAEKTTTYEFSIDTTVGDDLKYVCSATSVALSSATDFVFYIKTDGTVEIFDYTGTDTDIVIPSEINGRAVTSIGGGAFRNCESLTSVEIPDSVTSIDDKTFWGCTSLTSVEIPDSVTSIGNYAFAGCTSLTSVKIPDSVTYIDYRAFYGCTSLTSVEIPDSVTSIGSSTFKDCTSLTSVKIPDSVTYIDIGTFYGCESLTSVEIPDSVTDIGRYAFYGCESLTSVEIPDSVTYIGNGTFGGCESLTSVEIPDSVTFIGAWAFENCTSLTSVEIPDSVTYIGSWAFENCTSLTSVEIPDSVTYIGEEAFAGTSLTSVEIPDSVTSIGNRALGYWYDENGATVRIDNFKIYGLSGSEAEFYANDNGFDFVDINPKTLESIVGNISVTGVFSDNITLNVEEVTVANAAAAYDITLTDENGSTVQPSHAVSVCIPSDNPNCKVFCVQDDNTMIDMNAVYSNGQYEFSTDHFSIYALIENTGETSDTDTSKNTDTNTNNNAPTTGDASLLFVIIAVITALSSAVVFLTTKKYKTNK